MTIIAEADPYDALIRATECREYPELPTLGDVNVSVGERSFSSIVQTQSQTPFAIRVECSDDKRDFFDTDMGAYADIAPVFQVTDAAAQVVLDGGFLSGQNGTIDFRTWRQTISHDAVAATVWVLVGGPTGVIFPDPVPTPTGVFRPWSMERGLRCRVGGQPALIRQLWGIETFPREQCSAFAIARLGDCADDGWRDPLCLVLSLLFGTWLEPAMQYRTDAKGNQLWRRADVIEPFLAHPRTPAVDSADASVMATVGEQLEAMLSRCDLLVKNGARLEVAMSYLLGSHNGTEAEIRDMCSAIDAIAESPLIATFNKRFITKRRFKTVKREIDEYLAKILAQDEEGFRGRVAENLINACTEPPAVNQRMLWKGTQIKIATREREALRRRHEMNHPGYIKYNRDDNAEWRLVFEQAGLLRTLANRMLLSVLGYTGESAAYHGSWETKVTPALLNTNNQIDGSTA